VELWDTSTWHMRCSSLGHDRRSIRAFVWVVSSDEDVPDRLFSAGLNREVTEWDLSTLEPLVNVASGGGAVWALCKVGQLLCAACEDGSLRLFSIQGGVGELWLTRRLTVGKTRLLSVTAFGADFIFAGGSDSQITKWRASSATCEARMQVEHAHDRPTLVWSLTSVGDHSVASGGSLGIVQVWDPITCVVLFRFQQHQADVLSLAASPDGKLLFAGGIDKQTALFTYQAGAEGRWLFSGASMVHTHDIRAVAIGDCRGVVAVSGGISGKLVVHSAKTFNSRSVISAANGQLPKETFRLSSFSPAYQRASVAEESRLILCQRATHLDMYYMQPPEAPMEAVPSGVASASGHVEVGPGRLPEPQFLLRHSLLGAPQGMHLAASAITSDGRLFTASNASGTRLFRFGVEELEVRREHLLPFELQRVAARALLFCGAGLLAIAAWKTHRIHLLDVARLVVVACFAEHTAAVSLLASAGEWLASADTLGEVHIFNLDSLQHHARVPVSDGDAFPTAITFDSAGKRLLIVLSNHEVLIFDVEAQNLVAGMTSSLRIPEKVLPNHERVCGIACLPGSEDKILLWGHGSLVSGQLQNCTAGSHEAQLPTSASETAPVAKEAIAEAQESPSKRRKRGRGEALEDSKASPPGRGDALEDSKGSPPTTLKRRQAEVKLELRNGFTGNKPITTDKSPSPSKRDSQKQKRRREDRERRRELGELYTPLFPKASSCRWTTYPPEMKLQHIFGLWCLDAARWGAPVLRDHYIQQKKSGPEPADVGDDGEQAPATKQCGRLDVKAMVLTLEVTAEAAEQALPVAFQRKQFGEKFGGKGPRLH